MKIKSTQEFAKKLSELTLNTGMTKKEIKSLAKSLDYSIGLFYKDERKKLSDELLCLYAQLGSLAIKICYSYHPEIKQTVSDEIIENYKVLLCTSLSKEQQLNIDNRLNEWSDLFKSPKNYTEDSNQLTMSFYKNLTGYQTHKIKLGILNLRINNYLKLFIDSVNALIEVSEF